MYLMTVNGWEIRILIFGIGSVFAGLYFGFRNLLPYLAAKQSGAIRRRGYNAIVVRRDQEPERFAKLLSNRVRGAALGFGLSAAGAVAIIFFAPVTFTP